jgi:hypothetical protein
MGRKPARKAGNSILGYGLATIAAEPLRNWTRIQDFLWVGLIRQRRAKNGLAARATNLCTRSIFANLELLTARRTAEL